MHSTVLEMPQDVEGSSVSSFPLARLHTFFSRSWNRSVSKDDIGIRWRGRESTRQRWWEEMQLRQSQDGTEASAEATHCTESQVSCNSETASRKNMKNRLDQLKSNLGLQWGLKTLITEWKLLQGRKIISLTVVQGKTLRFCNSQTVHIAVFWISLWSFYFVGVSFF